VSGCANAMDVGLPLGSHRSFLAAALNVQTTPGETVRYWGHSS
jgi:hypothetical protein